jgi:hypothetical protein
MDREPRLTRERHPGLDPGSTFLLPMEGEEGGCRIKSGMTILGNRLKPLEKLPCAPIFLSLLNN